MKSDKPTEGGNQGEGDRSSVRRYNRHGREFVAGEIAPAGRDAESFVERSPEDPGRAVREARRGPPPTKVTLEELVAKGRTFVDRVESFVHRVTGRFGRRSHR